jgi:L-galactose dehydrogenase/L-glyceraldehyde 3-phosphate reductase
MEYRTLGGTGLRISEIGFGCGNVGGLMTGGDHAGQVRAVRRALDLGINYFDTAAAYGDGKSEVNLGRVLDEVGAKITLATKIRLGPEAVGNLKEATIASVKKGFDRLRRESVDIIQLHTRVASRKGDGRFTLTPAEVLGREGVVAGFKVLRDQGKVRYFGFSGLGEPQALDTLIDSGEFHVVQAYYNLLNPSAGQAMAKSFSALDYDGLIDRAAGKSMGVAVIRVLAAGILSERPETGGGSSREPLSPGSDAALDVKRAGMCGFLIQGDIKTLSQAAVRFALMKPEVSTVLVGFSNIEQIEEAAAASGSGGLPAEAMARLRELWKNDFEGVAG